MDGIAVSEQTYRQTERVFDYEELEPVQVKGKAEPLALCTGRCGPRPLRLGRDPHAHGAARRPGAGEVAPDRDVRARGAAALVPAGDGRRRAGGGQEPPVRGAVRLRRGPPRAGPLAARPLPALRGRDLVLGAGGDREGGVRHPRVGLARRGGGQARAGRCPTDDPDRAWLTARLAPLVGAPAEPAVAGGVVHGLAALLEALAAERPDGARVRGPALGRRRRCSPFSSTWPTGSRACRCCSCARRARSCTSGIRPGRPALATRSTINLAPLTDEETAQLFGSLLERAVLPAETQQALLERAGGNPLYAEEFVRLLADRGRSARRVEVPDSVQALIAARLDTLSAGAEEPAPGRLGAGQGLLGGCAGGDGRPRPARGRAGAARAGAQGARPPRPHELDGGRGASTASGTLLVRDVCYGQIPRAARAARHQAAAAWIERKAGERAEDLADVLAYHYLTALELNRRRRRRRAGAGAARRRRCATWPWPASGRSRSTSTSAEASLAQGARARPGGRPRARLAARALGAGRAAAGPAPGGARRRSRRRSTSTASRTRAWPPGGC